MGCIGVFVVHPALKAWVVIHGLVVDNFLTTFPFGRGCPFALRLSILFTTTASALTLLCLGCVIRLAVHVDLFVVLWVGAIGQLVAFSPTVPASVIGQKD